MNLCKIREDDNYIANATDLILMNSKNKIFLHNDQSIMNIIFYKNFYKFDKSWNMINYGCTIEYHNCHKTYEDLQKNHIFT